MLKVVHEAVIDLIGDHQQIMFFCDLCDLKHHFARGHCAGRVGWITDKNTFGARRDRLANISRVDHEIIFLARGHFHWHAARQDHFCLIRNKTRRGDDDFIARIKDGGECQIQRF